MFHEDLTNVFVDGKISEMTIFCGAVRQAYTLE